MNNQNSESGGGATQGRPGMCRNCGAIVAANTPQCPQCGAAVVGASQKPLYADDAETRRPDPATLSFARALFSRPATFTLVFLFANVLMFLLTVAAGGTDNPQTLVNLGAKLNSLIDEKGEWWRFVAPVFLHGGVLHLLMNMYGLWSLGPYVERLYGSAKFVFFWVVTGIAGFIASYLSAQPAAAADSDLLSRFLFKSADSISVGASGALFGIVGVLFVFGIKFRHELPEGFKRAFGTGMLPTIIINIFIGYAIPVIDNAAHLGGFVAGALLALVVGYKRVGPRAPVAYVWHLLQFLALALVVVSFALVYQNYAGPTPDLGNITNIKPSLTPGSTARSYLEAVGRANTAFAKVINEGDVSEIDAARDELRSAPALDETSGRLKDEMLGLLERARGFAAPDEAARRKRAAGKELTRLLEDFALWQENLRGWVVNDGKRFGIVTREPLTTENQPDGRTTNDAEPANDARPRDADKRGR